jgi:hypothetical protein
MEFSSIISVITAAVPSPWGPIVGIAGVMVYQWLKVRFPATLAAAPNLVHLPTPTPAAPAPPAAAPAHPILNGILNTILGRNAPPATSLAAELKDLLAPPQPSTPVTSPTPTSGTNL